MKKRNKQLLWALLLFAGCTTSRETSPDAFAKTFGSKLSTVGENNYIVSTDPLISQLPKMRSEKLDATADSYWQIVAKGEASIPALIESLTDTTITNVYNDCKKAKLNVGELSYFALQEIAEFPAFVVTHKQFDVFYENGCWSFYDYLYDNTNKPEYQRCMQNFYSQHRYYFVKYKASELNDSYKMYNITGHYKYRE